MAKNKTLVLDLIVDDDTTDEDLTEWLTVVLPLYHDLPGSTCQIQGVSEVRIAVG